MAVPSELLTQSLKEKVTCLVCNNIYKHPKQLPCLHVFCLECLNDLARTSTDDGKIKCPSNVCHIEVVVPDTCTMEALPSSRQLQNLLAILAIKEGSSSNVTCANCDEKTEEVSYCFHCGKLWCKACLNAHNILKDYQEHRVVAVSAFQDNDLEDILKQKQGPVCQSDYAKRRENTTATAVNSNIAFNLDSAKGSLDTISSCIQLLEEKSRLLKYRFKTIKEQIELTVKSLVLTLRLKEQELIAEAENQTIQAQGQLSKTKEEFQVQLNKRAELVSQIEALVERNTEVECVKAKKMLGELFQNLQELQDLDMPSTADWKTVTMFTKNQDISKSIQDLGIGHLAARKTTTEANQCSVKWFQAATAGLEAEIEVITRNSEGEQCYFPGDYVSLQFISAQDRNTVAEIKITDNNDGSYKVSFIPSEAGQQLLPTVKINGEIIDDFPPIFIKERSFLPVRLIANGVVEAPTLTESLMGLVSDPSGWIEENRLKSPWGVTVNDLNQIFVSDMDNNRIAVFDENGEFMRSFGQDYVNKPTGICIDNEGRIYVANRGDNKILLFNSRGEYITVVHNGDLLKEPRGISLDAEGNLVVCDKGNSCLQFVSPNGSFLKKIGEKGGLNFPFDCLCYQDKVFVSDRNANLVKVYSHSNGRFLYEFGRCRNVNEIALKEPLGLALDRLGNLLVSSGNFSSDHRVFVYTLEGRFVTAFGGSRGGELGQFGKPTNVTVLTNGRVVVCEFENCRLQVFD